MNHRIVPSLLLFSFLASVLPAQVARLKVEARFEPAKARAGEQVTLVIDATVDAGYHVYGNKQDLGVPTLEIAKATLALLAKRGEFLVPEGMLHVNPDFPDITSWWITGATTFKQGFTVKRDAKPGELRFTGGLNYMACTPQMCDPPFTQKLTARLQVVEPEKPALPRVHTGNHQRMEVRLVPKSARPGDVVTVEVHTDMDAGWHVYGSAQGADLGIPTTMQVKKGKHLSLVGDAVVPVGDPHEIVGDTYHFLEGSFVMRQKVRVATNALPGELRVEVGLGYMACDANQCDQPVDTGVGAILTVVSSAAQPVEKQGKQEPRLPARHVGNHQTMDVVLVPTTARAGEVVTVEVRAAMEDGWHNYGSSQNPEFGPPSKMQVTNEDLTALGGAVVPPGDAHDIVGDTYYFLEGEFVMSQTVRVPAGTKPGTIQVGVDLVYMACDDMTCDDEVQTRIGAMLTIESGAARAEFVKAGPPPTQPSGNKAKPTRQHVELGDVHLNDMSLFLYLLGAVGAGLFALVMPCTYPMIPITISFFTKQAEKKGGRPVFLALAYGGGIVFSYLLLGGLLAPVMQKVAADPWLNLLIGVAFVAFALSLFGMFELRPPAFLMNSATRVQVMASGSGSALTAVAGVFMMGVTLCITSFACTAPFLGSMIAAGASSGGVGRLLLGMGVFGLTMATPFVILSLVPGRLPRGGGWMNSAKILFGFVELAAALKFFSNAEYAWDWLILPREVFLVIWAVLFLVAGIYLLGMVRMQGDTGEIGGGRLISGTTVLVLAGYFTLGASGYSLDNAVMNAFEPPYPERPAHTVVEDNYDKAVEIAKTSQKLLLLNFTGKT